LFQPLFANFSVRVRVMMFDATFNNISVSGGQFYWWRKLTK
jgi:hypothetical protein